MIFVLASILGWGVAAWLPGAAVLWAFRPGAGALRNASLASLVSVGVCMLTAEALYGVGLPVRPWTVLPISVCGPVAVAIVVQRGLPMFRGAWWHRSGAGITPAQRVDGAVLCLATAIGVVVWCFAIRSTSAVLPNTDGTHHALFAERILRTGTLKPSVILSTGASGTSAHYYPLAIHTVAALIAGATGASVNVVLTVGLVLAAAVLLPMGTFVLVRRLFGDRPGLARTAAVISVCLPWFPYGPIVWGGLPLIVAMCQVPAALDAAIYRRGDGRPVIVGVIVGTAAYGLFEEHNSELVLVGLFAVILCGARWAELRRQRGAVTVWLASSASLAVFLVLQMPALISGATERSGSLGNSVASVGGRPTPLVPASSSAETLVRMLSPVLLVLALWGAYIARRHRLCKGWGWCAVATLVLFIGTLWSIPVVSELSMPWYKAAFRITYLFSYFEVAYGAVAIIEIAVGIGAMLSRFTRARLVPASAAALLFVVAMVELPTALGLARMGYDRDSLVGKDQQAAFAWLAGRLRPGESVLNQFSDGSSWMQTLNRVAVVFPTKPDPSESRRAAADRIYLLLHADVLAGDVRAQDAARRWNVRYVYVNDRHFDGMPPNVLTASGLSESAGYRLLWHRGEVTIFAVDDELAAPHSG